jgi:hypothetical protein
MSSSDREMPGQVSSVGDPSTCKTHVANWKFKMAAVEGGGTTFSLENFGAHGIIINPGDDNSRKEVRNLGRLSLEINWYVRFLDLKIK